MEQVISPINETNAAEAFSEQSVVFDGLYGNDTIIQYKRDRVRNHVLQYLPENSNILELNSGTGDDAIFFAGKGHCIHATDISSGMQEQLRQKVREKGLNDRITNELCSYTALHQLKNKGPYDLIFSNFAGLNCTNEMDKVLASLPALLKPKGMVTLVIMPKFCLWETLLLFKGKFRTAFRRFFSSNGRTAHVEGHYFKCWYYNPSYITKKLKPEFEVLNIEGLCTIVPPSYVEGFAKKHPSAYSFLKKCEDRLKSQWTWKYIGDYYIISLRKKY
ncbi:bifunctional 2-polyprenyl-6-hydroxyphenol methylase/3-demethylubiquinol 3-O-methyltransferase UbiG [Mucilaginibacter sp. BT774]|uniref:class I SAM-dependent methyltransferase n=1 Tax=Mucilaginibacter sp. BT774 TaxID=3062276 RepID=UPI002674F576|nr:class I SAM-dependent methyltransferase [Mucilaginibacter sp. BT774]MDO3624774.1 class I SAM-dependent methyltransferase [Mucilaginibacter sp. BT774]